MHLASIHLYPVKSLRGFAVPQADLDALGLVGDRRFLVIDETGRFLTQRALPRMTLVSTALSPDTLTLSAEGHGSIGVSTRSDPAAPLHTVAVWKSEGMLAEDCGDAVAMWLGDFLQTKCRLVRIGEKFVRPVLKVPIPGAPDFFHFGDGAPLLVISEASLGDLNDRLVARGEEPLPMDRFRPNFVVSGSAPFAEDDWPRFTIGGATFRAAGPCVRCIMTTTNQLTGERGKEPLRTLATYRRNAKDATDVNFGQNVINVSKSGTVRVGDSVQLLA